MEITGLFLSFLGSAILAVNAIKSKKEILSDSPIGRVPVSSGDRMGNREEALLEFPSIKSAIWQGKVAIWGLSILTGGFVLQIVAALLSGPKW